MNTLRWLAFFVVSQSSLLGQVLRPVAVLALDANTSPGFALESLIDGSGLSGEPTLDSIRKMEHDSSDSSNAWTTNRNFPDYFSGNNAPPSTVLAFNFSGPQRITGFAYWGYRGDGGGDGGNEARSFTFRFVNNDSIRIGEIVEVTLATATGTRAREIELPTYEGVYQVQVRITDNFYRGDQPAGSGGDRIGLSEVRLINRGKITVTTLEDEDDGAGSLLSVDDVSLREAIVHSDPGSKITFSSALSGGTIRLSEGELLIEKGLTIDAGDHEGGIIIDGGGGESRCLRISDGGPNEIDVVLTQLTFQNGSDVGDLGGGNIHNDGESVLLTECHLLGGRAVGGAGSSCGGGIFSKDGSLSLISCTVSGNETRGENGQGGGVFSKGGVLTVESCTFSENGTEGSLADGGGIYREAPGATSLLSNCTFFGNSASSARGGAYANFGGNTDFRNCTIVGNSSVLGGGIFNSAGDAVSDLRACLVSDNLNGSGVADDLAGPEFPMGAASFVSGGRNLIGAVGGAETSFTQAGDTTGSSAPIRLAPLGDYGGFTQTMHPLAGSPAILATEAATSRTDQRGFTLTSPPTIGAVKVGRITMVTSSDISGAGSLRSAILAAASGNSQGEVIIFDPLVFDGEESDVIKLRGFQLLINRDVFIDASNIPGGVVIDGGGNGQFNATSGGGRCLFISDYTPKALNVVIFDLTFRNGSLSRDGYGANLVNNGENVILNHCRILDGRAFGATAFSGNSRGGGGIFSAGGSLVLNSCVIAGNQTLGTDFDGGGIYNQNGNLTMNSCVVTDNVTFGFCSDGGGVYSHIGDVFLKSCTISGNRTEGNEAQGGGLYKSGGDLVLESCRISGNKTQGNRGHGGGIFSRDGSVKMKLSTISKNLTLGANTTGAGVYHIFGEYTLDSCTVSGNEAEGSNAFGGGFYVDTNQSDQDGRISNCTFVGNSVEGGIGGAFFNSNGKSYFTHCTIVGNSASAGGGMASGGKSGTVISLTSCVVRDNGNSAGGSEDLALSGELFNSFTSGGGNLVGSLGANVAGFTMGDVLDTTTPILLAPLGNYGGPTQSCPPLSGSPLLDGTVSTDRLGLDQRGFPRLVGSFRDIGAVEFQGRATELDLAFDEDIDGDGTSVGVELAIGSDPFLADVGNVNALRVSLDLEGNPEVSFGVDGGQQGGIILRLIRSDDLVVFDEVVLTNESDLFSVPVGGEVFRWGGEGFMRNGRGFYRLEAIKRLE